MDKVNKKLWKTLSSALREIADDIDKAKTNYEVIELAREAIGTGYSLGCSACLVIGIENVKKAKKTGKKIRRGCAE